MTTEELEFDARTDSINAALTSREKVTLVALYAVIGSSIIFGFIVSTIVGRMSLVLAGLGIVAFVFGLRHGIDADHIAAIDNTTRKLLQEGKRSLTVGTWFSLGHSTIVVALIAAFVLSTRAVAGSIPTLQGAGAVVGTAVSGTFLWIMGLINVAIAFGIYEIFVDLRNGRLNTSQLDKLLTNRGFLNRYFSPLFKIVKKPWQIYPVGLLFGLGFDTASEIALIAISVGVGVSSNVPLWDIMVLPFMFTCGMVLVDTTDGIAMRVAYGWAFLKPIRKIYYNLTITVISVLVAFVIGSVELFQVLSGELGFKGAFWSWLGSLDFETLGFGIIVIFVVAWLLSIVFYKYKGYERTDGLPGQTALPK
ncbi:MAG: HoxN/HupN/NixA family nickel/cobalt transporter [Thaumarchaeota archaeon]|nr:HoxN/HupN/NixA family nickel/cobalt transporter [Nitrososphaerota archaeon]